MDIISENKVIKKKRKSKTVYTCPFCSYRGNKYNCVMHIERVHQDVIPDGFTAARVFFNYIHRKQNGKCIICNGPTRWNEDTWRYDRLCDKDSCKKKFKNNMKRGMVGKYGTTTLLNNPEHQQKMLNGRSISGEYRFKDGGVRQYVGSYEKNLLEYFDKVMGANSKDVCTPGPTIEYYYKGEKHFWITDVYYVPANLIIEVKDGGNNPNRREMPEYRAKQLAKEKALEKMNKYNYIRLTDNNFVEFAKTINDIKENLEDNREDIIFNVLESMSLGSVNPTIGTGHGVHMVSCMIDNKVYNTGFTKDKNLNKILMVGLDGKITSKSIYDIDTDYITRYTENDDISERFDKLESLYKEGFKLNKGYDPDFMYEFVCQDKPVISDQCLYDDKFVTYVDDIKSTTYTLENTMFKGLIDEDTLPIMENELIYKEVNKKVNGYPNLEIQNNPYGFVIINNITGETSGLYSSLKLIRSKELDTISGSINVK